MCPKLFLFLILCLMAGTMTLSAQENYEVRKVTFTENNTLSKELLLDKMATKELSWAEKVLTKKEPFMFSSSIVENDLERIVRIYQSEGFINASARLTSLRVNDTRQTVKISIGIEEGRPVLVDSLSVKITPGNAWPPDIQRPKLIHKLSIKQGVRFRDESVKLDRQVIEEAWRNRGYAYAAVSHELEFNPKAWNTSVTYLVNPGPKTSVGITTITGNQHVSEAFIQKQLRYRKDQPYSKSLLDKTRQDLYRLQLFRVVSVLPQKDEQKQESEIPVAIYLEEAPRLSSKVGAGYGTEDMFRTFIDLTYRGFMGGARRVNLYLKHSALEPYSARMSWVQPRFFGANSSISINPFIIRNIEPGYDTRIYGVNIPVTYHIHEQLTTKATYYLEDVKQRLEMEDAESMQMESDQYLYNKSGVLLSAIYNSAHPTFSPEGGVNLSVGLKINGYLFGRDFDYTRLWGDFRGYLPLRNSVLAFRLSGGSIKTTSSENFIPVEDRFYAGGSNSIRGWNRAELGPKRESGSPLGGRSIFESNLELRFPLIWKLSMVTFIEAGNVWEASWSWPLNELAYAAGAGLRIETPIGPIRFDAGVPLRNEKRSFQFFISVGQAF